MLNLPGLGDENPPAFDAVLTDWVSAVDEKHSAFDSLFAGFVVGTKTRLLLMLSWLGLGDEQPPSFDALFAGFVVGMKHRLLLMPSFLGLWWGRKPACF